MARGVPVKTETRARIVELMNAGELGRNAIARETGTSVGSVSMIANDIGHTFDRSKSALAIEVAKIDRALIRSQLADAMLLEAWRSMEDMHAPALMVQFEAGKQITEFDDGKVSRTSWAKGKFRRDTIPEPTFSDKRNLMTVAGIAISKATELTREAANSNPTDALAFIDGMQAALEAVRNAAEADKVNDPEAAATIQTREQMIAEFEAQDEQNDPE